MISRVAVVPSTPVLLADAPGRRHPEVDRLSAAAARATDGLGVGDDVVVVLAGGPAPAVHAPPPTDLRGYGLRLLPVSLGVPPGDAVAAIKRVWPSGPGGDGGGPPSLDLAVLARWLRPGSPAVGVVVPPDPASAEVAPGDLAEVIVRLAEHHRVGLLVAGDLGAGHGPKPPRPEAAQAAAALDELVVAALDNGRPASLVRLDVDLCRRAQARATGALGVLGAVLDRARLGTVVRAAGAPLGVGYVVAAGSGA